MGDIIERFEKLKKEGIKTKPKSIDLYEKGFFGNKSRNFFSFDEYINSGYDGKIVIRARKKFGGGICLYDLDKNQVIEFFNNLPSEEENSIWMNAALPKENALVQGEFYLSEKGPYFHCSFAQGKHLRDALRENGEHIQGLRAWTIIKELLSPASYSDFLELLDIFPNSVIELSVYDKNVGENLHRNAIFWEVRDF